MAIAIPQTRTASKIIQAALTARTPAEVETVAEMIVADVGARCERPLGDRTNNLGLLSHQGNMDHKILELLTNGQDGVLELYAALKFASKEEAPYKTPHDAARALLGGLSAEQQAELVRIDIYESDPPTQQTKRVTPVVRDYGCGLTPGYVPRSIFFLGSQHKDDLPWLQGAFGLGGTLSYRNAHAVVLVTRRHPELLSSDEEDRITVAVCRWQEHHKGQGLFYLVTEEWPANSDAEPWSAPASEFPDFEPGTQLALVSYSTSGFHRGRNDRRGFEFMFDTRLWDPVLPVRVFNQVVAGDHPKTKRGLKRAFEGNPRPDRHEGSDKMPFRWEGKTYQLPVHFFYFEPGPSAGFGGMRNFVYDGHAAMFVSNGQCHKHWTPQDFRQKVPPLNKLYDRLLVVVDTDVLPIQLRTRLFTPDRSQFVDEEEAQRLEKSLANFLGSWEQLGEINTEVLRKALASGTSDRPTIAVAEKIARALKLRGGFRLRSGTTVDGPRTKKRAKAELWPDPTTLEGPTIVEALPGEVKFLGYHVNAVDEFFGSGRGKLDVVCEHPRITEADISVGPLHNGHVRVSIAVPDDVEPCETKLLAGICDWMKASGGVGADHTWETTLRIVSEKAERPPTRPKKKPGEGRDTGDEGSLVALLWRGIEDEDGWNEGVPGHVDQIPAALLAESREDYKELASLGEQLITTLVLNREYAYLQKYLEGRLSAEKRDLTEDGANRARDRYAIGLGVGLVLHQQDIDQRQKRREQYDERSELHERQAIARGVLAMMPEYDALATEAGVDV